VVVAAGASADPVDQDHVGAIADREVRGVPGGGGEPLQVRCGDLAQAERAEDRQATFE
jgi:hypothetical protein